MENKIQIFENAEFGKVRTLEIDNEPWFVGKDVLIILGYTDLTHGILDHVDEEDRVNSKTQGLNDPEFGQRGTWLVNESGLYSLILSSKLPQAKSFKRWVTAEVLPSIRKTGSYALPQDYLSALKALVASEEERLKLTEENQVMKPKAEYFDALVDKNCLMNFRDTAKELGQKQNQFISWLLDNKFVYRDEHKKLKPYAGYMDYFSVKEYQRGDHTGSQTLITPHGREAFRLLLN